MGFLSAYDGTHTVKIPREPGHDQDYWVVLREHITHGGTEKSTVALQALTMIDGKPQPTPNVWKAQSESVLASIVEWNLTDRVGNVLPINMNSLRSLPDSVFTLLNSAVEESNKPRSSSEEARFPDEAVVGDPDGDRGAPVPVELPAEAGAVAAPWPA